MTNSKLFSCIAVFVFFFSSGNKLEAADAVWSSAQFSSILVVGEGCDDIFKAKTYEAQHFLVGPTNRTSVIHLRDRLNDGTDNAGFFDGISFIGLYGGSGDVFVDRDISKNNNVYRAHLEGFLDHRVIYLQLSVKKLLGSSTSPDTTVVCEATADFSGFN